MVFNEGNLRGLNIMHTTLFILTENYHNCKYWKII